MTHAFQNSAIALRAVYRWRSLLIPTALLITTLLLFGTGGQSFSSGLLVGLIFLISVAASFCWEKHNELVSRHRELELQVREQDAELDTQRAQSLQRNKLPELLVNGQPLGSILDQILISAENEVPGSGWVILLKSKGSIHLAAAKNVAGETRRLLLEPKLVPFEAWHTSNYWPCIDEDSAWKGFVDRAGSVCPRAVYSRPIEAQESRSGVVLMFPRGNTIDGSGANPLDYYSRLIRVAYEHHLLTEDLRLRAHHDSLTGLPNRIRMQSRLEMTLDEARCSNEIAAVVVIDLDGLKQINDTLGQRAGDFLLQEVAARLRTCMRTCDSLARLSGDDFSVLLRRLRSAAEAQSLAEAVLTAIRQPFSIQGERVSTSASIGVAVYPGDGSDPEVLMRHANAAMNCAKGSGRDQVQMFSDTTDALDRFRLLEAIRLGLRENHFQVYYQPKYHDKGHIVGFEALARFNHPKMGKVPPSVFIPAAEHSGLIVELGQWVLRDVCQQIAAWRAQGLGEVPVAVNVSSLQLDKPNFAANVEALLADFCLPAGCLELELTESLLISCTEDCHQQLRHLRNLGIRISIDDFGTGYSSLSYLHRLPVNAIKLDRSFVQTIDTDEMALRLVQAMIGVAQRLGLEVVAEGVEREEQRQMLSASGCYLMQGFLFAYPKPAAELAEALTAMQVKSAALTASRERAAWQQAIDFGTVETTTQGANAAGVTIRG